MQDGVDIQDIVIGKIKNGEGANFGASSSNFKLQA
jgi:hypothetical protein